MIQQLFGQTLNAAAAQVIGLGLHELATNAIKYGALSTAAGHVEIRWEVRQGVFKMTWIESKGPPVKPPERHGFGTTVITSLPKMTIDREAKLDFPPSGVTWHLTCPASNVLLSRDNTAAKQKSN
jgi:two-component sensor histidine kinase